jgi:hypothetical protein
MQDNFKTGVSTRENDCPLSLKPRPTAVLQALFAEPRIPYYSEWKNGNLHVNKEKNRRQSLYQ